MSAGGPAEGAAADAVLRKLRVKIFADGADRDAMIALRQRWYIKGFTTNPTLMRKAGVSDYEAFARDVLAAIPDLPVSFEVFSDDFGQMARQARKIASWGSNVYVKIPITNTSRQSSADLVRDLSAEGIQLNVTALLTLPQVEAVASALAAATPAVVSVFAGRIADTGRDPIPLMAEARAMLAALPRAELLWASPREVLNVLQADETGCHIITATSDILNKLSMLGRELDALSLDTVKMFHDDAAKVGYRL